MAAREPIGRHARPSPAHSAARLRWRAALGAVVVVLAAASLVFEQSPANEVLRTNAALRVLEDGGGPVAVGLVVAAITVAIELGSALLITLGLHAEEGYVQRFKRRLVDRGRAASGAGRSGGRHRRTRALTRFATDVAIALGLGAGLVTVRHHVLDPEPSMRRDLVVSVRATAIVAVVSGLIGYLAAGGITNAEKVGLGTPAQWVIDYGTDTRFWVSVLVVGYGIAFAVKLLRGRHRRRARAADTGGRVRRGTSGLSPALVLARFEGYIAGFLAAILPVGGRAAPADPQAPIVVVGPVEPAVASSLGTGTATIPLIPEWADAGVVVAEPDGIVSAPVITRSGTPLSADP
jgi:hypothetical protein